MTQTICALLILSSSSTFLLALCVTYESFSGGLLLATKRAFVTAVGALFLALALIVGTGVFASGVLR